MKKMAEIIGKTGAFAAGSMICAICWTPRGRTEVILEPKQVPPHKVSSVSAPFCGVKEGR